MDKIKIDKQDLGIVYLQNMIDYSNTILEFLKVAHENYWNHIVSKYGLDKCKIYSIDYEAEFITEVENDK